MILIYTLNQLISLYPAHIVIVNRLSAVDIHLGYRDIVEKS
ncbi:MAG: hypothetical protein ACTS73_04590 [Arsenophonus sp. NEOnobi-MAG3]